MANEATIRVSLKYRKGNVDYQSGGGSTSFNADVDGTAFGPVPGAIVVTNLGTAITFAGITNVGLVHFKSLDTVGYIEVGVYDPERGVYFPIFELLPGEWYVLRLSRNFGEELGTGTGTTEATNQLWAKVFGGGSGALLIEGFES